MRRFARLFDALDASTATQDKVAALVRYLVEAPLEDAAWAVYFLAGGKPRQVVPTAVLRGAAQHAAGIDDWLFEASYQAVGDLAETLVHVWPQATRRSDHGLAHWVEHVVLPLRGLPTETQIERVTQAFDELDATERFVFVKLIGGGFRVGVSKLLVQRALAQHAGIDPKRVAQRMMGWTDARASVSGERLRRLLAAEDTANDADAGDLVPGAGTDGALPYPFFLAHAMPAGTGSLEDLLGPANDWLAEWKFDGIRAQVVCRAGQVWVWSRGEELMTDRFPEVVERARQLPAGTVLDGELLVWLPDAEWPASFQRLQQRIGRKTLSRKLLAEVPVVFVAYDLLEWQGRDLRGTPQAERRRLLESVLATSPIRLSPLVPGEDWPARVVQRARARELGVEGLMLKHVRARYGSGRTRADGTWWKWKVDPLTVDAVLIYAQAGHGRRAGVYTDYTFAVWNRPPLDAAEAQAVVEAIAARRPPTPGGLQLVAFAKAYSGLTDAEFAQVDRVIRAHTLEKFGPVRSVRPTLVFELGFEGINRSPRHKSGVAVRFPRMLRIRDDKPLHEADNLPALEALITND
jgi:DNA ligase 1